ncbi:uncharacterized protein A1O9_07413 [Exophiala aquamarina CBS 119918]|uniref:Potassium channel domain-containing protein n=1 Tax=Exophiala aquamarina CBS 119918 TaxID=1182545 RepID=A0A072PD63_9EURO|nr:uncharacterized protein A1O9_07413 [Exophiala aquamarina CBS 119918]KEF57223.1 hypothetical protein A1O9_07413 [Exophiala aquamarina CBS 119918]
MSDRIIATNAVSLAIAATANLTLISKFSRGPASFVGHSIVIVGWYISSFLLIPAIAVASISLQLPSTQGNSFSQAFYYACFACGLYFIVSSLMLISVYAARSGYYSEEAKCVRCETALTYQTIIFKAYLLIGALVFSNIEKWNYLDAVYWADNTILTIGLGDYAPKTHLGRSLVIPYAVGGVLLLGLMIASIQSFLTQRQKRKTSSIMKETQHALLKRLQSSKSKGKINEEDFKMFRDIQERVSQKHRWILLFGSGTAWFVLWFLSAAIFKRTESVQNWSYFQALFFTFIALMTIGYGDLYPVSNAGKAFFVFWSLLAVPTITILVSSMGDTIIKRLKDNSTRLRNLVQQFGDFSRKKSSKYSARSVCEGKTLDTEHRMSPFQNSPSIGSRRSALTKGKMCDESTQPPIGTENRAIEHGSKDPMEEIGPSLGKGQPYYHYLLIKEISNVAAHLFTSPSRKFTYDEWAWFLALISRGEHAGVSRANIPDEFEWVTSRDIGKPGIYEEGNGSSSSNWLTNGSYLKSGKSEAQWMLEQLIMTLKRELIPRVEERR